MPYTLGATHPLVGSGVVAVAGPVGLLVRITAAPSRLGQRFDTPTTLFGIGSIRPGTADGWHDSIPLDVGQKLAYPIADGATRVGYSLAAGVTADLVELAGALSRGELERHPSFVGNAHVLWNPAGQPDTAIRSYTVPAGKLLLLRSARVQHMRYGAMPAVSASGAVANISVPGVAYLAWCQIAAPETFAFDAFNSEVVLSPGQPIDMHYLNQENAGAMATSFNWQGVLIDA
jgi:hypothetical protein